MGKCIASLAMVLTLVLQGCNTWQPAQYTIEKEFVVRIARDEAATRIKKWLLQNGFIIVENTPTIITASISNLDQLQGYAYDSWSGISYTNPVVDCGIGPKHGKPGGGGYGTNGAQLSISIDNDRMDSGTGTRVFVNFVPIVNRSVALSATPSCVSNGTLERTIKAMLVAE